MSEKYKPHVSQLEEKPSFEKKVRRVSARPLSQAVLVSLVIVLSTIGGGGFIYHYSQQALIRTVQNNLLSTAESAAYLTNVGQLRKIENAKQKEEEDYRDIQDHHLALLSADKDLAYIYTLIQKDDGKVYFITDIQSPSSKREDDTAYVMEVYESTTPLMLEALEKGTPQVESSPSEDKWGKFLSAYAPLRGRDGELFGIIGVDVSLDDYSLKLSSLRTSLLFLALIGITTSGFVGFLVWDFGRKKVLYDKIERGVADIHDIYLRSGNERRKKVFCAVLRQIVEITESRCGFIAEVLSDEKGLYLKAHATCLLSDGSAEECFSQGSEVRHFNPLLEAVLKERKPTFANAPCSSLSEHQHFPCGQSCLKSYLGIPVLMGEEVIALISVSNTSSKYSNKTVSLLRPLIDSFVSTIDSIRSGDLLLKQKEYSDHIITGAPALIVGLTPSGITRFINPVVSSLTKYDERELIGNNWWWLMHPEEDKDQIDVLMDFFSRNIKISDYEMVLTAKGGEKRTVSWTSLNRYNENSDLEEIILIGIDNTERNEFQGQLVLAKEEAEKANRAKSDFLAGMSHEIRTPMNGVLGTLDLLSKTELNEGQKKYLEVIRGSGRLLLEIINEILEYSKIESGSLRLHNTVFSLADLVRQQKDVLEPLALKKSIGLELNLNDNLPDYVFGDEIRIRQILTNITGNAIKFTPLGGRIRITVCQERPEQDGILFEVADSGIGIAEDKLDQIFAPFEQIIESRRHSKTSGTGLGLAICKHLVQMMEGKIGVRSQLGEGSVFWFSLPLPKATREQIKEFGMVKDEDTPTSRQWNANILVVEDVATNQFVITKLLENLGCQVSLAGNGKEAVEVLENSTYDLVLMDCNMPVMDGFEATRKIRALQIKQPPIVALTANVFDEDREKCFAAGMDDFVSKPVEEKQILRVLQTWAKDTEKGTLL